MKTDNKAKGVGLTLLSSFLFLFFISFISALSPPKLTSSNILCSEIRFNSGILGASDICDGIDTSGLGVESDPYWTGNISNYYTRSDIIGFGYYNTSVQIWGIIDNGTFLKSYTETDPRAYNGTLAYNQTLTDMWASFLSTTNLSYLTIDRFNVTNTSYLPIDKFNVTNTTYRTRDNGTFTINISTINSVLADNLCYTNGTNCPAGGSGDITAVYNLSKYFWINSSASGDVYLNFSEIILNETIDNRERINTTAEFWAIAGNGTLVHSNLNWNTTRDIVPALNNSYDLGNSTNMYNRLWVNTLNIITKIQGVQIANSAITAALIQAGAINATHVGTGAVNTTGILDNTISPIDLSSDVNATMDLRERTNTTVQVWDAIDNSTFRKLNNVTFTGGVNLTNGMNVTNNITLQTGGYSNCLVNRTGTAYICHNGTGWIIKG